VSDEYKKLEARVADLEKVISGLRALFVGGGVASIEPADDAELDSRFGDPSVRKSPTAQFWKGESFAGRNLSRCTPAMLDAFMKYKLLCAKLSDKDPTKSKYAEYDRKDAARALGWKLRIEGGWKPPADTAPTPGFSVDAGLGADGCGFGDSGGFGDAHEGDPDDTPFILDAITRGWRRP
jgi:hypothetical protein